MPSSSSSKAGIKASNSTSWVFEQPFPFIVGKECKKAYIHPSLISGDRSKYLDVLINGSFKEAHEKEAVLPDVDAETFGYFAQYVYTGTYQLEERKAPLESGMESGKEKLDRPKPSVRCAFDQDCNGLTSFRCTDCGTQCQSKDSKAAFPRCSSCEPFQFQGFHMGPAICVKCGGRNVPSYLHMCHQCEQVQRAAPPSADLISHQHTAPKTFISTHFAQLATKNHNGETKQCKTVNNREYFRCTELIEHARVYVFADQCGIQDLCKIALVKLHADLCKYELNKSNIEKLVELPEYVWENTVADDGAEDEMETLQALLVGYVFDTMDHLRSYSEFSNFIKQNVKFAQGGFLRVVVKKIKLG